MAHHVQMLLTMETLATVIQMVRKNALPAELAEALTAQGDDLRGAFDRLSARQKNCYRDWVGSGTLESERQDRAALVVSVVRTLSSMTSDDAA